MEHGALAGRPLLFSGSRISATGLDSRGVLNQPQVYRFFFAVPAVYLSGTFFED